MFALSLKGLSPCKGFVQQLVPTYENLRHLYHIFTFSLPNQTLYSEPFISKSRSLLNISCHACKWRAHTCNLLPLASSTLVPEKGQGSCWSRTWLHMNSSSDGAHSQIQQWRAQTGSRWTEKAPAWGGFSFCPLASACGRSVLLPSCQHKATQGRNTTPPTDPCIHLFLQTAPAHHWGALWQLWTGREVSFTGWGGVTSDCAWLGFSLELHQGETERAFQNLWTG